MVKIFSENIYGSMCLYLTVFVQHLFTSPISIVKVSFGSYFPKAFFMENLIIQDFRNLQLKAIGHVLCEQNCLT